MADPRLVVGFDGIGAEKESYIAGGAGGAAIAYSATTANGSTAVGKAVTLAAPGTVGLAADGEAVIGKLLKVEPDGVCVVQTGGYVTLPGGVGASLTLGKKIVGAVDAQGALGYIRECGAQAAEYVVARGFIVDAGTASATVVKL